MLKTCKCGKILNDSCSPNKAIYSAYTLSEWEVMKRWYKNTTEDIVIRDFWHCTKCDRIYSRDPVEDKEYIYWCREEDNKSQACICKDTSDMIELIVINEIEDGYCYNCIVQGKELKLPRSVYYCKKCKKIFVSERGRKKVYKAEEIHPVN